MRGRVVVAAAALLVVAGTATALALRGSGDPTPEAGSTASATTGPATAGPLPSSTPRPGTTPTTTAVPDGTGPAPSSEPGAGDAGADGASPDDPGTSVAPGAPATVTVSFAGWDAGAELVTVNAFVDGVESGGTCSLALSSPTGAGERAATAAAFADATTTVCDQLTVAGADLAAGTWTATVTYTSGSRRGSSAATDVEVVR